MRVWAQTANFPKLPQNTNQNKYFSKKTNFRRINRGPHCGVWGSFLSVLGWFPGRFHENLKSNREFVSKLTPKYALQQVGYEVGGPEGLGDQTCD